MRGGSIQSSKLEGSAWRQQRLNAQLLSCCLLCTIKKVYSLQDRRRNYKHTKLRLEYGKYCCKVLQVEALNQHITLQNTLMKHITGITSYEVINLCSMKKQEYVSTWDGGLTSVSIHLILQLTKWLDSIWYGSMEPNTTNEFSEKITAFWSVTPCSLRQKCISVSDELVASFIR